MIVLVCGGRDFQKKSLAFDALDALPFKITKVINGAARGADKISSLWAKSRGIDYQECPADWNKYGKAAGPIRNSQMLSEFDIEYLIAFPGGTGTEDMIKKTKAAGIPVVRIRVGGRFGGK